MVYKTLLKHVHKKYTYNNQVMKKLIIKCLIIMVIITGIHYKTTAQKLFYVFAHGRYDAASLDKSGSNNYTAGIGAEAGVGIGANNTFFNGTIGYTNFISTSQNTNGDLRYIPVKAGIRYYLPLPVKLIFINTNAGVGMMKNASDQTTHTSFAADAGAGVKLGALEILTSIDAINEKDPVGWLTWWNIKAGLRFGL